jgi:multiple sugar transport system permease protein
MPDDAVQDLPDDMEYGLPEGWERWWWPPVNYGLAVLVAVVFAIPLVWMVATSLRPLGLPPATRFEWLPPALSLGNYPYIFQIVELGRFLGNSVGVVLVAVPLTVLTASLAGFALAQLPERVRNGLIAVSVAALLVPSMALWITRFLVYKAVGILDTPLVLIAPAIMGTSPFYVLLFAWAFARVPRELYEQARLDGAGAWRLWWLVGLPQVRAVITAVVVLAGLHYWSDFIDPVLYINNQQYYTLPIGIQTLQQMVRTNWPLLMAGAVVLTVPVLVVFIVAQRYFFSQEERTTATREAAPPAAGPPTGGLGGLARAFRSGGAVLGALLNAVGLRFAPLRGRGLAPPRPRTLGARRVVGRGVLALITLLALTITVPARPDRDGFQAAHFFFMPRATWEMDEGRGMLHPEGWYEGERRDADAGTPAAIHDADAAEDRSAAPPLDGPGGPLVQIGADAGEGSAMPDGPPALTEEAAFALPSGWTALPGPSDMLHTSLTHPPPVPPPRPAS